MRNPEPIKIEPCYGENSTIIEFNYEVFEFHEDRLVHKGKCIVEEKSEETGLPFEHRFHFEWWIKRDSISQVNIAYKNTEGYYSLEIYTVGDNASAFTQFKKYADAKAARDTIWAWVNNQPIAMFTTANSNK